MINYFIAKNIDLHEKRQRIDFSRFWDVLTGFDGYNCYYVKGI